MMSDRFNTELCSAHQALRHIERGRAMAFEDVLGDVTETHPAPLPRGSRRRWERVALSAALAVAALAILVLRPTGQERFEDALAESIEQFGSSWVAPSDFLMSYPGRVFYSRIPSIGPDPAPGVGDIATNPRTSSNEENP